MIQNKKLVKVFFYTLVLFGFFLSFFQNINAQFDPYCPESGTPINCVAGNTGALSCGGASGCVPTGTPECFLCNCTSLTVQNGRALSGSSVANQYSATCNWYYNGGTCDATYTASSGVSMQATICGEAAENGEGNVNNGGNSYSLEIYPSAQSVAQGNTTTYTISVVPIFGMDGQTVHLALFPKTLCPINATCSIGSTSNYLASDGYWYTGISQSYVTFENTNPTVKTATLTVTTTASTPLGTYSLDIAPDLGYTYGLVKTAGLTVTSLPPPPPTNLVLSCPSPFTTVNASWTAPSGGYNNFKLRANPGAGNYTWPAAVMQENVVGTSSSFTSMSGQSYNVWVHTTSSGIDSSEIAGTVSCVSGAMSGTLSATNCTIAQNASSCNTSLTWSTTNPVATSGVTSNVNNSGASFPNFSVATGNSGSGFSAPVFGMSPSSRTFYLYNNGTQLSAVTATATCVSGTTWNGTICASNAQPDLTASAPTPGVATVNTALTFSANISNIGGASTGASFPYFFQRATAANGGGTVTDLASATMSTLAASGNATATSPSISFSSAGTYSVRVCADKTNNASAGSITESNESNNCSNWTNVTVSSGASPSATINLYIYPNNVIPTSYCPNTPCRIGVTVTSANIVSSPPAVKIYYEYDGPVDVANIYQIGNMVDMFAFFDDMNDPGTYQYCVRAINADNSTETGNLDCKTYVVTVAAPTFQADRTTIYTGESISLSWICPVGSTGSLGSGGNFVGGPASSAGVLLTPASTTTYTLTCNPSGSSAQVTVIVKKKPIFKEP